MGPSRLQRKTTTSLTSRHVTLDVDEVCLEIYCSAFFKRGVYSNTHIFGGLVSTVDLEKQEHVRVEDTRALNTNYLGFLFFDSL